MATFTKVNKVDARRTAEGHVVCQECGKVAPGGHIAFLPRPGTNPFTFYKPGGPEQRRWLAKHYRYQHRAVSAIKEG